MWLRFWGCPAFALVVVVGVMGCGESHGTGDDGGIEFDAEPPVDAGPDAPPVDGFVPECGDGVLSPMEQCDDGNTAPGDGCDGECRREAFCGDMSVDSEEVCDDGNNRSGDGCRSDCRSDESCGNGIRDSVVGEQCDDGNTEDGDGCSSDCTIVESCGDDTVDDGSGETCDDGNTDAWDGCGPDCLTEISMIIDSLEIGGPSAGCDYTGDGEPDNAFGEAFGGARGLINDMFLTDAITNGELILLMHMLGLDDPSGASDDSLTVAWMQGEDADMNPDNNFSGMAELYGAAEGFDDMGNPTTSFASRIASSSLSGGPEDVTIPISMGFPIRLDLRNGRIHGTTTATSGEWSAIEDGLLCGAVPSSTLALIPNIAELIESMGGIMVPPPCDGSMDRGTLLDLLVGGVTVFGIEIGPAQPDVDLDGDGLEYYETDSGSDCQGVITACIDGDGTRVEGRGCATDPRFEDGFSAGLPFTAVRAHIIGLSAMMGGGMMSGP